MLGTLEQIRLEGNLPNSVNDTKLNPHLITASIEVRRVLGETKYAELELLKNEANEITKRPYTECSKAESLIALSIALHSLNIETAGTGIVQSKGWDQGRSEVLSRNQVINLSNHFRGKGMEILLPYIPDDSDDETLNIGNASLIAI